MTTSPHRGEEVVGDPNLADSSDPDVLFRAKLGCSAKEAVDWAAPIAFKLMNYHSADADDLIATMMAQLVSSPAPQKPVTNPRGYVRMTLMNCWRGEHRRNRTEIRGGGVQHIPITDSAEAELIQSAVDPAREVIRAEIRCSISQACKDMRAEQLDVFLLAMDPIAGDFHYRSRQEIADLLGIPVGTVKRLLSDAKSHLRSKLSAQTDLGSIHGTCQ